MATVAGLFSLPWPIRYLLVILSGFRPLISLSTWNWSQAMGDTLYLFNPLSVSVSYLPSYYLLHKLYF